MCSGFFHHLGNYLHHELIMKYCTHFFFLLWKQYHVMNVTQTRELTFDLLSKVLFTAPSSTDLFAKSSVLFKNLHQNQHYSPYDYSGDFYTAARNFQSYIRLENKSPEIASNKVGNPQVFQHRAKLSILGSRSTSWGKKLIK